MNYKCEYCNNKGKCWIDQTADKETGQTVLKPCHPYKIKDTRLRKQAMNSCKIRGGLQYLLLLANL